MASEHMSAFERGRIPTQHMWQVQESLEMAVSVQNEDENCRKRLLEAAAPLELISFNGDKSNDEMADSFFHLLRNHFMPYDMWSRPYRTCELPPIENVYPTIFFASLL